MSEVMYELKNKFPYAYKGESQEAQFISITAPTFKQMDKAAPIKQAFMVALSEISNPEKQQQSNATADETGDDEIDGDQVMQLMYNSSGDIRKVLLSAEQLFKAGAALIDGETPLTTPLMHKMHMQDFEGLVGAYIANFIAASLLNGQ